MYREKVAVRVTRDYGGVLADVAEPISKEGQRAAPRRARGGGGRAQKNIMRVYAARMQLACLTWSEAPQPSSRQDPSDK